MNWLPQSNPYYLRSECGSYSVVKIGGDRGFTYEAAFHREQLEVGLETADDAKLSCESHAEKLAKGEAA